MPVKKKRFKLQPSVLSIKNLASICYAPGIRCQSFSAKVFIISCYTLFGVTDDH